MNDLSSEAAKYLIKVSEDDKLYASYFWWRDFYEVRSGPEDRAQGYCELCRRLNDPDEPDKVYKDMYKWWVRDSHCRKVRSATLGML